MKIEKKWEKKGLIFSAQGRIKWAQNSGLTPTPILLDQNTIRIYAGFRDKQGVSRIGYLDVSTEDPTRVINYSQEPVLDIGSPGTFDDNGVILGDIISNNDKIYMYYVGFQSVSKVKFLAFSGLAISLDGGCTFKRRSEVPVLDRSNDGRYIRAIHSVIMENNLWRVWYANGNRWQMIGGKPYPSYNIRYAESNNGIDFKVKDKNCVEVRGDEYRIGRPRVYRKGDYYEMYYTKGDLQGNYLPGYAVSMDGLTWERRDEILGLRPSLSGWDSSSLCYLSLVKVDDKTFAFYNGNNMGEDGIGLAILLDSKE